MIEIFDEAAGIIFAFLLLQRFYPVGVEHRQNNRNQKNDHQPGEGKIFHQTKRLDSLFRLFDFQNESSRYFFGR